MTKNNSDGVTKGGGHFWINISSSLTPPKRVPSLPLSHQLNIGLGYNCLCKLSFSGCLSSNQVTNSPYHYITLKSLIHGLMHNNSLPELHNTAKLLAVFLYGWHQRKNIAHINLNHPVTIQLKLI